MACKIPAHHCNRVGWIRDEGLSTVEDAVFSDLPALLSSTAEPSPVTRVVTQLSGLVTHSLALLGSASSAESEFGLPARDAFNMRKVLVLATRSGKLFGIDTATATVRWQRLPKTGLWKLKEPKLKIIRDVRNAISGFTNPFNQSALRTSHPVGLARSAVIILIIGKIEDVPPWSNATAHEYRMSSGSS